MIREKHLYTEAEVDFILKEYPKPKKSSAKIAQELNWFKDGKPNVGRVKYIARKLKKAGLLSEKDYSYKKQEFDWKNYIKKRTSSK